MDAILTGLINAGGLGLLAAALFLLHRESIKAFRDELHEERAMCREAAELSRQERQLHHTEVIVRLARIEDRLCVDPSSPAE